MIFHGSSLFFTRGKMLHTQILYFIQMARWKTWAELVFRQRFYSRIYSPPWHRLEWTNRKRFWIRVATSGKCSGIGILNKIKLFRCLFPGRNFYSTQHCTEFRQFAYFMQRWLKYSRGFLRIRDQNSVTKEWRREHGFWAYHYFRRRFN